MEIWMIPRANWHMMLTDAIEQSKDGDRISVIDDNQRQLGESAKSHMCPNKKIEFVVEPEAER